MNSVEGAGLILADKAMNFKFCTHIPVHTIDRNKSPLTISRKIVVGVARDSRKFSVHPYYRAHRAASRGHSSII